MLKIIAKGTILVFSFFIMLSFMAMIVQLVTNQKIQEVKIISQDNNLPASVDHLQEGRNEVRIMYGDKVEIVKDFVETKRTQRQRYKHVDNYIEYIYYAILKERNTGKLNKIEYRVDFRLNN